MTSRPAAPSRRPSPAAPRGGPAFPLASAGRSCHIILLLFSPYLELLSRQFRPRARLPRLSCVWYPQVRGTFFGASVCVCVCVCICVCVFGGIVGAREESRSEGKEGSHRAPRSRAASPLQRSPACALRGSGGGTERSSLGTRRSSWEQRGPLCCGFLCLLELGCQGG